MPFPDLIAMGFTSLEDSSLFKETPVDPSINYELQGGIVITRKRYTRAPATEFETGFTSITSAEKAMLLALWTNNGGGANPFAYDHPDTGVAYQVRFTTPFATAYKGVGIARLWDVTGIKLRTL